MLASALLRHGPELLGELTDGLVGVADGARVRVGRAAEGQHEPGVVRRLPRLRARAVRPRDRRLPVGAGRDDSSVRGGYCGGVTSYTQSVNRRLPRGWRHLALQIAFWLGFYVVYQVARGLADGTWRRRSGTGPGDRVRDRVGHAVRADAPAVRRVLRRS